MNLHRNELLEQYLEKVLRANIAERDHGRTELVQSALRYLNTAIPQQRLSEPILTIFSANIGAKTSFDFAAARNVFSIMEKYVINLLDCPWKREFRKITMYSGFYKTRIEPSLKEAWKLLRMMGYEKVGLCLELHNLPDTTKLQDVAFEFYLASLECSIYKDIFQKVSSLGFTLKDIHKCRRSVSGNSDVVCKALSKFSLSEKRGESVQNQGDLSDLSKRQPYEKHSGYDANMGCGVQVGAVPSEGSQQQMGSLSTAVPLPGEEKTGDGCETRTESIEAMLQEITPEMISDDVNIRHQILTKFKVRPRSAKSQDEPFHASLPLHQVQRESNTRPYTEPLLIPKQPKPDVASASNILPYSDALVLPRQPRLTLPAAADKRLAVKPAVKKREGRVVPFVQQYTEPLPVPKQKSAVDSDQRPYTEPLLIPKQEKIPARLGSKSSEALFPRWQCLKCGYFNNPAISVEKCHFCGQSHKEV